MRIRSSRFPQIAVAALCLACSGSRLSAQRSLPFSDDALVLGFGQVRSGIHGSWQFYDQVYRDDGTLAPYGSPLSFQSAGSAQFSSLTSNEVAIRAASGQTAFQLSFGTTDVNATHRTGSTSLLLDVGLPGRFMLSAEVPFVRVETTVNIAVNNGVNTANVGINPATTSVAAFAADTALANQVARARTALSSQLATCAGSTASSCATVNARRNEAQTLVSTSSALWGGLLSLATSPFAPLASSAANAAITARIAAVASAYRGFGINSITGTAIAPANLPITAAQFRNFLATSNPGPGGALPSYRALTRLGDVSASAKFRITDTERIRAAAFGRIYFPTGGRTPSGELFPLAAGEGTTRAELGGIADLFVGERMSLTASGSSVTWFAGDVNTRSTTMGALEDIAGESDGIGRSVLARRSRRTGLSLSVTPRYSLNRWLTLGLTYEAKPLSREEFTVPGVENLPVWNQRGAIRDNRIGAGFSFSNLAASRTSGPRFPIEASFFHTQSISGSGLQPKIFSDEFRIRIFARQ